MNPKPLFDPGKHHRRSIRLKGYDYSQDALYFVTVCSHKRICMFGNIINGEVILNEIGRVAMRCWQNIPTYFEHALLQEYIIMPNHVHGIIELQENHVKSQSQPQQNHYHKIIPGSLGSIIRGFKTGVTNWCQNNGIRDKVWQRNYHEHILRNSRDYNYVAGYILSNPNTWSMDQLYKSGDNS